MGILGWRVEDGRRRIEEVRILMLRINSPHDEIDRPSL
jgi:hypothetical protein